MEGDRFVNLCSFLMEEVLDENDLDLNGEGDGVAGGVADGEEDMLSNLRSWTGVISSNLRSISSITLSCRSVSLCISCFCVSSWVSACWSNSKSWFEESWFRPFDIEELNARWRRCNCFSKTGIRAAFASTKSFNLISSDDIEGICIEDLMAANLI